MRKMLERLLGEDIEIILKTPRAVGSIHADANQLEQAILNLAVNARDAMGGSGRLVIAIEDITFSDDSLAPKPELRAGRYVMLSISDTGSGMDAATRTHLFEPFFTTKERGRGTGLGLSTVYGIVKQSKGSIYVYSEPGKGTTFKLYFPRIYNPPAEPSEHHESSKTLEGTERILVLEDEQQVLKIIEVMLSRRGYSVLTATDRENARSVAEDTASLPLRIGKTPWLTAALVPDLSTCLSPTSEYLIPTAERSGIRSERKIRTAGCFSSAAIPRISLLSRICRTGQKYFCRNLSARMFCLPE
jgi:CheY-like chemotaxis protein